MKIHLLFLITGRLMKIARTSEISMLRPSIQLSKSSLKRPLWAITEVVSVLRGTLCLENEGEKNSVDFSEEIINKEVVQNVRSSE